MYENDPQQLLPKSKVELSQQLVVSNIYAHPCISLPAPVICVGLSVNEYEDQS